MKELSANQRALLAGLLSVLVIVGWSMLYKPPQPPPRPPQPAPPQTAGERGGQSTAPSGPTRAQAGAAHPAVSAVPPKAATEEKTIVVENDLYRVELSNRGAVVRSWELKKYKDDHTPARTLNLVHAEVAQQAGWPFSLALDEAQLESAANAALYVVTPSGPSLIAPVELLFDWSDGRLEVSKRLQFDHSYLVGMETSVALDGKPLAHGIAWRGGFGDTTVYMPAEQVMVFWSAGGKLEVRPHKKLALAEEPAQRAQQPGAVDYGGIEDRYFVAAFLPRVGATGGLALWNWKLERDTQQDGKPAKEPISEMAVGMRAPGPLALRSYVGPKDLDDLKKVTPPLSDLIQFGWMEFIAEPLFYLLKWIHRYVPNYGWAIIAMTVLINMVLFPLKVKSFRSMQRMQKVAPQIKAIQERYKKYSMRDPRKQEMNKEIMALYQREGINPAGGCLPMLLQMPIWFALYRMLNVTIELRHARWLGWIHDLSVKDPYYILPVLMALSMYTMQKMTPVTTTDPAQQRMMNLMPLMMGILFFALSSGLVLYILTSNFVGMAQQWYLGRTSPLDLRPQRVKKK